MSNPWFRLYSEAIDDEKLRLLAFEDRWHFIALLCCKNNGILDNDPALMMRKVAIKLGLAITELGEVAKRLADVGLIDRKTLQPTKWEKRQYIPDNKKHGSNESGDYRGYVYFIGHEGAETIKIGYSKNPWARLKEFQIGSPVPLSVVATIRTSEISEVSIHDLFKNDRVSGEWHKITDEISNLINLIKEKKIHTSDHVVDYVKATRSNYGVTTTYTDTEEDKELNTRTKGKRIDPNLTLNFDYLNAARLIREIDSDELQRVFDEFKDYWISVPGAKGVKLDWLATWRNWVRRAKTTAAITVKKDRWECY